MIYTDKSCNNKCIKINFMYSCVLCICIKTVN